MITLCLNAVTKNPIRIGQRPGLSKGPGCCYIGWRRHLDRCNCLSVTAGVTEGQLHTSPLSCFGSGPRNCLSNHRLPACGPDRHASCRSGVVPNSDAGPGLLVQQPTSGAGPRQPDLLSSDPIHGEPMTQQKCSRHQQEGISRGNRVGQRHGPPKGLIIDIHTSCMENRKREPKCSAPVSFSW